MMVMMMMMMMMMMMLMVTGMPSLQFCFKIHENRISHYEPDDATKRPPDQGEINVDKDEDETLPNGKNLSTIELVSNLPPVKQRKLMQFYNAINC